MREGLTARGEAKRGQIRDGARRIFLQRGFSRSSTDDIAAEAGVSKQTLYVYYRNKEELLADVLRNLVLESPQAPLAGLEDLNPQNLEELRAALLERMERVVEVIMSTEYLALLRIIISEAPWMPGMSEVFRSTVPETAIRNLAEVLERTNSLGITSVPDAEVAARMLVGNIATYALLSGLLATENTIKPPSTQQLKATVDLFVKAVENDH